MGKKKKKHKNPVYDPKQDPRFIEMAIQTAGVVMITSALQDLSKQVAKQIAQKGKKKCTRKSSSG